MSNSLKEHWEKVFAAREVSKLGWYENIPAPSIQLLSKCSIRKDDSVLDVGAGATTFIDYLIEQGFKNIIAVDISETALNKLKERLGKEKASLIRWIIDDVTRPIHIQNLKDIALWHDRALLHFLLEENQRQMYLSVLKKVLRKGGYAIIATFSLQGAKMCSGLNIKNYDQSMLAEFLGEDFTLIEYFNYTYYMPSGDPRPYIYTLFQRK